MGGFIIPVCGVVLDSEKRRFPRYQLATPLTGVVEQAGERYLGSILNISVGGFYLHLSKAPGKTLTVHGDSDYGEIHHAGRCASGFGHLVRVEKFEKGVGVGFKWDLEAMDQPSCALIAEVVGAQEARRAQGRVTVSGNDVMLAGHVSSALANDVFSSLRALGAGKARLSLQDCQSIDSSGIEMLLALRDRGLTLVNAREEIAAILLRFQLSASVLPRKAGDE